MTSYPAYHRVAVSLRGDIELGRWQEGEQMPTEAELVKQFDVSRNTVRQALNVLLAMNLITRRQGRGTFVAPHGLSHLIGELNSLTEVLRERGFEPGTENLTVAVDPDPPLEAEEHPQSSVIWRINRVRTADSRPFAYASSWVADEIGRNLNQKRVVELGSLYLTLRTDFGILLSDATEIIRAEAATSLEATALAIRRASPVIVIYRWVSDNHGRPVEYARSVAPGDRYQYLAKLRA